jgi:elongator complex protein 1
MVESGVTCAQWSPDESLLVLTTGNQTLLYMTHDFALLSEQPLHPGDEGREQQVNVGWGKKETQFHGSEGKQAALKQRETRCEASVDDVGAVCVSWRGDAQFFCTSVLHPDGGCNLNMQNCNVCGVLIRRAKVIG